MINIKAEMYRTMEEALKWYATASESDIHSMQGSLARICLGKHGSSATQKYVRENTRFTPKIVQSTIPVSRPISVLKPKLDKDHNQALGAVAEEPAPQGAIAPPTYNIALNDLEQPVPVIQPSISC